MGLFGLFKPNVWKMEAKGDVEGLIKALKHRDYRVRKNAAWVLGDLKDVRAVEPLKRALKDKDYDVRKKAAEAIDKMKYNY
jgi:HEAT repeat protein